MPDPENGSSWPTQAPSRDYASLRLAARPPDAYDPVQLLIPGASLANAALLPPDQSSPAREREAAMLARCVAIACGRSETLQADDAPVLALAASLLQHRRPEAAHALATAAEQVRSTQHAPQATLAELLRSGLITDLPRFKERLLRQLGAP